MAFSIHASANPAAPTVPSLERARDTTSRFRSGLRQIRKSKQALIGLAIFGLLVFVAIFAPVIAPADPGLPVLSTPLGSPSASSWFGTDELGRDVFGRIIHGSRISLGVAALAVGISMVVGIPVGLLAGYWGGVLGTVLMRVMDALQAFPTILLAIAIASTLGPGIVNAMIAIGIVGIPGFARLARGEVLRIKAVEYVTAARASGAGNARIMCQHILPNGVAPLIIAAATSSAGAILTEAALSFVGLGATPPQPSWGSMLQSGYPYLSLAPWLSIFPGLAISLTTFGLIFLGDGLRDIFDPRLRQR
jgi:peptide/nickel transport system permease protein